MIWWQGDFERQDSCGDWQKVSLQQKTISSYILDGELTMCSVIRAVFQPPVSLLGRPWQQLSYPNTAEWAKRPQNFTLRRPGAPTL